MLCHTVDVDMARIVLDTNVLVASAYRPNSASRRIVDAVQQGAHQLVVSPAIVREYEAILPKAVRFEPALDRLWRVVDDAERVAPQENPPVSADRSDDKFLAAAVAGQAECVVSSDEHLLAVHPYEQIAIMKPAAFLARMGDSER